VATIAEKAKAPALAGGAALAGIAGGMALSQRRRRGPLQRLKPSVSMPKLNAPKIELEPKKMVGAVGRAAETVAERSEQVGRLAQDVRRASKALNGEKE
jgi:hypothetical protein